MCIRDRGRQDFGDGDGSLLNHIEAWRDYYKSAKGIAAARYMMFDAAERVELYDKFIKYLKQHLDLSIICLLYTSCSKY